MTKKEGMSSSHLSRAWYLFQDSQLLFCCTMMHEGAYHFEVASYFQQFVL